MATTLGATPSSSQGQGITFPDGSDQTTVIFPAAIAFWENGVTTPTNWVYCNGTGGSPVLVDRFIICEGPTYGLNATGGSASISLSNPELPNHTHGPQSVSFGSMISPYGSGHAHNFPTFDLSKYYPYNDHTHSHGNAILATSPVAAPTRRARVPAPTGAAPRVSVGTTSNIVGQNNTTAAHTHPLSVGNNVANQPQNSWPGHFHFLPSTIGNAGSSPAVAHENRPPYYALYAIYFLGQPATTSSHAIRSTGIQFGYNTEIQPTGFPRGGILFTPASYSSNSQWQICDGTNGSPDLRDRFIVGAGSSYAYGATGGSTTVALSSPQLPVHSHPFPGSTTFDNNTPTPAYHFHPVSMGTTTVLHAHAYLTTAIVNPGGPGPFPMAPDTASTLGTLRYQTDLSITGTAGGIHYHPLGTASLTGDHSHPSFSFTTGNVSSPSFPAGGHTDPATAHSNMPPYWSLRALMRR